MAVAFLLRSATKRGNFGDETIAIERRPLPVVKMGSLRIPGAQHGAAVWRAFKRIIADAAIAVAHDRQEETFRCFSGRWHLEDIAAVIGKAARHHGDAARERHHLLDAELEVPAD